MNRRNKILGISIIVVLVLSFFLINKYIDNQYVSKIPVVPDLNEMPISFQEYIKSSNEKTLKKPSAENLGELGMVYHANNYFKEAEACYLLAIERAPKEWIYSYYLGCLKRKLGDSENAIKNFNDVLAIEPNQYMAQYYKAEACNQVGEIAKFEEIIKSLSTMDKERFDLKNTKRTFYFPLSVYASLELAKFYASKSKVELAENELKALISREISFGPAYKQLSVIYAEKGNKELSKYYSDRSKDLDDYVSPIDTMMDKLSFYSRSETYLLKQIEDATNSSNLLWALELVDYSLKKVPESNYFISKGIKLYLYMNMANRALPFVDKHLEAYKDDYKELIDVGQGFINSGLKNVAQRYFLLAEKFENEKPETQSRLAGVFFGSLGMKDKAFELLNKLLEQHPNDPAALGGATALYIQTGDMVNANKYLSQLKKIDPKNPRIHIFNGIIAKNSGDIKGAVGYYEKAFIDVPDQGFVIIYLADYYRNNNMWTKLTDLYETALTFLPNNPNLQEAYGTMLLNCPDENIRDLKKAKDFSERAFINYKSNEEIKIAAGYSLALCYSKLNENKKALYYIYKTIEIAERAHYPKECIASLEGLLNELQIVINSK